MEFVKRKVVDDGDDEESQLKLIKSLNESNPSAQIEPSPGSFVIDENETTNFLNSSRTLSPLQPLLQNSSNTSKLIRNKFLVVKSTENAATSNSSKDSYSESNETLSRKDLKPFVWNFNEKDAKFESATGENVPEEGNEEDDGL